MQANFIIQTQTHQREQSSHQLGQPYGPLGPIASGANYLSHASELLIRERERERERVYIHGNSADESVSHFEISFCV